MALFQNPVRDIVRRLENREFSSPEERDGLLASLGAQQGLKPQDVLWMLFRPDRALRDAATPLLQRFREPETVDAFVNEAKGKPDAALRAAGPVLFSLGIPGAEKRLSDLTEAENADLRQTARRLVLESPPSKGLEPVLWQLASTDAELRSRYLERLAALPVDANSLQRWSKLANDPAPEVRDAAIDFLARNAPEQSAKILAEQLPHVGVNARASAAKALSDLSNTKGEQITSLILPMVASGDTAARTTALQILLSDRDRTRVVRAYIEFSKRLAGFVRDRALDSLREFGTEILEPLITLLGDQDDDVRAAAMGLAASFDDKRLVPVTIPLLKDPDWWVRIVAAETLGRLGDPRAVEPLMAALDDPDVRWTAISSLGRLADPRALPALGKLLGDPQPDVRIEVMQALKNFKHPQVIQALITVATKDASRDVRGRALELVEEVNARDKTTTTDIAAVRTAAMAVRAGQGDPKLNSLLVATRAQGASDFHLVVGQPPIIRMAAELRRAQGDPWTAEQTVAMLKDIVTPAQWERLEKEKQLDFCYFIHNGGRYRANIFLDHRGYSAVFRVIPDRPPTLSEIGLPAHLAEIADYHQGLVMVCGPTGSGKSTTLAALVNHFNEVRTHHVITLEDPIEFVHPFKNCLINQREVGTHTTSYARALRAALREDPDVIVIGELRDNESVSLALTAAETGHIVLGTLNSVSAAKAIDRIILSFPNDEQPQVRASLSESLRFVIAQKLLPGREARKQVACFEILRGTSNISMMIRDEKTYQIYSAIQIGRSLGMQTFDEGIKDLLNRQIITPETAYTYAQKKEDFEHAVSPEFLQSIAF